MKATTRRGDLPAKKKKRKKAPARGFMCGCGGASSVSTVSHAVNISAVAATPMKAAPPTVAKPAVSGAKTAGCHDADGADAGAEGTPSVDSLLRQLRELERGVRALGVRDRAGDRDDAGGGSAPTSARPRRHVRGAASDWGGVGRLDLDSESVAVVTESEDPVSDFRWSMVQMIVENGITGGAELRELLRRFLALNSPCHHHLILLAFADVWEELFAGVHAVAAAPPPPSTPLPVLAAGKAVSHSSVDRGRASKLPPSRADTLTTAARSRRVT